MDQKNTRKVGRFSLIACLLLFCATTQSCRDEYLYDNPGNTPAWLGESIYEELQNGKNFPGESFTNFLKVIDDLGYKEVLLKTGSKTLFVANDEAFMKGIKDEWGFDSYDQLMPGHKRIILYGAMLDNAYLLEMMSSTAATGSQDEPNENLCLRQKNSTDVTDTIYLFYENDIPPYNRYWDHMRERATRGIRLATDATDQMMVHFLSGYVNQNAFTDSDMKLLLNRPDATTADAYIFDKKVIKRDVTCKNGYIHQLDGLLIPPSNMAEEIRTNGRTTIFSRILERFSVPVYNQDLTDDYNERYHFNDDANSEIVYEKRYFTEGANRTDRNASFTSFKNPDMDSTHNSDGSLVYSPGWNAYQPGLSPELNMGAIFAPTDSTLRYYFEHGAGKSLIDRYGKNAPNTIAGIDSIPTNILSKLMNVLMRTSFNEAVPSKFKALKDDAQDNMGVLPEHIQHVDGTPSCIIANNGVVYLTKAVYSPADYVAVSAPILLQENLKITERAVDNNQFYAYYKSMQSNFSVVVCADDAMVYYDPCTSQTTTPNEGDITIDHYAYQLKWNPNLKDGAKLGKIESYRRTYSPNNPYQLSSDSVNETTVLNNALLQILEYCTVVGDFTDGNQYYMAKGYGTIKVKTEERYNEDTHEMDTVVTEIWGGRELEDELAGRRTGGIPVGEIFEQENGKTYRLDEGLIHPSTRSVYNILNTTDGFTEFANLCNSRAEVIERLRLLEDDKNTSSTAIDPLATYYIFHDDNGLDQNVRAFDTYHYTVYVPTDGDINEAYSKGLPKWEDLEERSDEIGKNEETIAEYNDQINDLEDQLSNDNTPEDLQIQSQMAELEAKIDELDSINIDIATELKEKIILITSFVKYHFQDNSIYVDKKPHSIMEGIEEKRVIRYETTALDEVTNRFAAVTVQTETEGEYAGSLRIEGDIYNESDAPLNVCHVVNTGQENVNYNIMARDIVSDGSIIKTSSYAVVHQLDGYLVNERIFNSETGRFELTK